MDEISPNNLAFYWSSIFIRELHRCGLRHVILSPGSRSSPLTLASAVHKGMHDHVTLDERSAAFTALGIGKSSGKPALLICTSGTAAANYHPAVIEARKSGVAMIVATADRPPMHREIGTSQSIDQLKLYGDYPVLFHEVGEPVADSADFRRLGLLADQAFTVSIARNGPVHLNFPFRKPLEPDPHFVETIKNDIDLSLDNEQIQHTELYRDRSPMKLFPSVHERLEKSDRALVIAGPLNPFENEQAPLQLAEHIGAPLLADPGIAALSENRIAGYDNLLQDKSFIKDNPPDLILRFGRQPVSKIVNHLLENSDAVQIHFSSLDEWQDYTFSTDIRVEWNNRPIDLDTIPRANNTEWLKIWAERSDSFVNAREKMLADTDKLTDGHVFHTISTQVPGHWNLFLSNSFPVRDYPLFGSPGGQPVYVNRGASGIDGITSMAIGATIDSGQPGLLFIGDLAFLHDANALLNHDKLKAPLVVVILNNRGGTIFRMLPIAEHQAYFRKYFETPQNADIKKLSEAHGLQYHRIERKPQLGDINLDSFRKVPGIHIIECRTDPDASMELRRACWKWSR
ncbi:MAG: 2-succinyl-5-enolpyruvyl-6-hydroxy-3-cyclohexene-1-carboxylic-acid synthase [Balneolaceae bacterium]|nr:2-succinyl-5-enolpyruvyl-6-hydroxy-3-cyclohexene-1-carboxylic-acid synthase [Balneolaceae bacterium]